MTAAALWCLGLALGVLAVAVALVALRRAADRVLADLETGEPNSPHDRFQP